MDLQVARRSSTARRRGLLLFRNRLRRFRFQRLFLFLTSSTYLHFHQGAAKCEKTSATISVAVSATSHVVLKLLLSHALNGSLHLEPQKALTAGPAIAISSWSLSVTSPHSQELSVAD